MKVHSGRDLDPRTLTWRDISISDVARGLSTMYVWRGHSRDLLTYAEHCTLLSQYVAPELGLAALLKLGFMAYVYPNSSNSVRIMDQVNRAFGVTVSKEGCEAIRAVEQKLYAREARECWDEGEGPAYSAEPLDCAVAKMLSRQAEHVFNKQFCDLYQGWS